MKLLRVVTATTVRVQIVKVVQIYSVPIYTVCLTASSPRRPKVVHCERTIFVENSCEISKWWKFRRHCAAVTGCHSVADKEAVSKFRRGYFFVRKMDLENQSSPSADCSVQLYSGPRRAVY